MECQLDKREHLRCVLLFHYNKGLGAAGAAEKIQATYGEEAVTYRAARKWVSRFSKGNFHLGDSGSSVRTAIGLTERNRELFRHYARKIENRCRLSYCMKT
ncbi:hypothetical protein M513_04193 [Trichuris suis]|uniref:Mos1 transposase HTH domain-containing protein n=1 Tax=Trichuris suis TaxID=68888 RepID=A0A085MCR5_9BILA|nr:hypothetical protein M513_04193 [Trichuris suis]